MDKKKHEILEKTESKENLEPIIEASEDSDDSSEARPKKKSRKKETVETPQQAFIHFFEKQLPETLIPLQKIQEGSQQSLLQMETVIAKLTELEGKISNNKTQAETLADRKKAIHQRVSWITSGLALLVSGITFLMTQTLRKNMFEIQFSQESSRLSSSVKDIKVPNLEPPLLLSAATEKKENRKRTKK